MKKRTEGDVRFSIASTGLVSWPNISSSSLKSQPKLPNKVSLRLSKSESPRECKGGRGCYFEEVEVEAPGTWEEELRSEEDDGVECWMCRGETFKLPQSSLVVLMALGWRF